MDTEQILERLKGFRLFQGLPDEMLQEIAEAGEVVKEAGGRRLFTQGDPALAAFFLLDGEVVVWRMDPGGREIFRRTVRAGQAFGFRSLLKGDVRLSTAETVRPSTLLRLPASDFARLQAKYPEIVERLLRPDIVRRLRAMPLLGSLTDEQLRWVVDLFERLDAEPGEMILSPPRSTTKVGPSSTDRRPPQLALYLIDQGQVAIHGRAAGHMVLTAGHYFGSHRALGVRYAQTARAVTRATLYGLTHEDFDWLRSAFPGVQEILNRPPDIIRRLHEVRLFSRLSPAELEALAGYVCWDHYPAYRTVTQQGDPGDAFYILDRGEAVLRVADEDGREQLRNYLVEGNAFGETSLILKDTRDATVESLTPTDWLVLHHDDFRRFLEGHPDAERKLVLREETREKIRHRAKMREEGEETILFRTRRHWWSLVKRIAFASLIFVGLLILLGVAFGLHAEPAFELAVLLGTIILLGYIIWHVIDWNNDWLIVTTRRIIHQERVILVSERRIGAPLEKIQDISVIRYLWANLLGYGHLIIQTAATEGRIEFRYVPNPEAIRELIQERRARALAGARAAGWKRIRRELEERLDLGIPPVTPSSAIPQEPPSSEEQPQRKPWWRRWRPRLRIFAVREEVGDQVIWRKHPVNLLMRISRPLITLIAVSVVGWLLYRFGGMLPIGQSMAGLWFGVILLEMLAAMWLLWEYEDWRNDQYIVTSDRIIDIERKPLFFAEDRREAGLGMIQNVTSDIPNPIAYILGYGNVTIETAAEMGMFDFVFVPNPREVQAEILRRVEAFRARQAARERAQRHAEMAAWFEMYNRLQREQPG